MAAVRPEFYVQLKQKKYPIYEGVLIAAHEEGLLGISVRVTQYPSEANGWSAVCAATVTMRGDGEREQIFEDVGDCSPKNASPQIALASIRMASTRAKGRALRDAIALGATLFEELPAWETEKEPHGETAASQSPAPRAPAANGPAAVAAPVRADVVSRPAASESARSGAGWEGPSNTCSHPGCSVTISHNNEVESLHKYQRPLCRAHMDALKQQAAA